MKLVRLLKHWMLPGWRQRRIFSAPVLAAMETAIGQTERTHRGEIRFVVEKALKSRDILAGKTARQRAEEVFTLIGVDQTDEKTGVLIYVLLADGAVEIIADEGIDSKVGSTRWWELCRAMESAYRQKRHAEGSVRCIQVVADHLSRHFPARESNPNELPDRPILM